MVDDLDRVPPNPNDWSTVVFPPINHENLQIPSQSEHTVPHSSSPSFSSSFDWSDSDSSSLSPSPSPSPSPSNSQVCKGADFTAWLSAGLQILRSKISSFRNRAAQKGAFWSFGIPLAALLASCFCLLLTFRKMKTTKKNQTLTPKEARLTRIINYKDKRIAQLLHQIAQMNEILIDRHKALAAKNG